MQPLSELLLRSRHRLQSGRTLLVNWADPALAAQWPGTETPDHFCQQWADHRLLESAGLDSDFGLYPKTGQWPRIVLKLPREKARLTMLLDALAPRLAPEGELWLFGEKRAGINSAGRLAATRFATIAKADSARHGALFIAGNPGAAPEFDLSRYIECWPDPGDDAVEWCSLPGTFAHGRHDRGSAVLLQALREESISGRVLDFGCGSGVIGLSLLARHAELEMFMLDSSAPALESTRMNMMRLNLNADVRPSDGLAEAPDELDWIISNPPFHAGVATELEVTRRFLAAAGNHLVKAGKLAIVCNRHLPWERELARDFAVTRSRYSTKQYKVLICHRGKQ